MLFLARPVRAFGAEDHISLSFDIRARNPTPVVCQKCGNELKEIKNKGVDVALAIDLLIYGMSDTTSRYDVAMLVSGGNDFIPVIEKLKDRRPQVNVEVAQFRGAVGFDMMRVADRCQ